MEEIDSSLRPSSPGMTACRKAGTAPLAGRRAEGAVGEIAQRTEELASLSAFLQTHYEQEKARLARQLHDELGGILTPAKMDLSWLESRLGGDAQYRERMARLAALIDQGIDLKRRVIEELHPSLLDHLGLAAALQWYVDTLTAYALESCHGLEAGRPLRSQVALTESCRRASPTPCRFQSRDRAGRGAHAQGVRLCVRQRRRRSWILSARPDRAQPYIGMTHAHAPKRNARYLICKDLGGTGSGRHRRWLPNRRDGRSISART